MSKKILVGLDVGSTTVKAVVMNRATGTVTWKDYQRHETRQAEKALDFLARIETETGCRPPDMAVLATGSGAGTIAELIGAKFVQEVNAVTLAVRALYPGARSVIELGGQDAKIIVLKEDPATGTITAIPSMNDKCASGTGATIEKIAKKIGIPGAELANRPYLPYADKLVHIAAKCGVFAETDVVSHLKAGLPEEQILASLFDAIVSQNLSVLTRGNTLHPDVLLLGGPNTYLKGMVEAWRHNIPKMWLERNVTISADRPLEELIRVPADAQYFAAIGAVRHALQEGDAWIDALTYRGTLPLRDYIESDRTAERQQQGGKGLVRDREELAAFLSRYPEPRFTPAAIGEQETVDAVLGIDGGSTSTKAVLVDLQGRVLAKTYQLANGNPIQDTMDCVRSLREHVESAGALLNVEAVGTTGYAKDILLETLCGDAAIVETVAHTMAARHFYRDVDVIVDVGGQDIKIIMLKDGRVADFRLNTQCSAGNGYFLQSTCESFNIDIRDYAKNAFEAEAMPEFGYGCAVFMQSDIVNFQKQGWTEKEIMAGLAAVLPKNIWLYVSKIPNLASLGRTFVLQGGTQHNQAAVKAQVDFIVERFADKDVAPEVIVHEHCGEAGAIGAALEALRLYNDGRRTAFIGLDAVAGIHYIKTADERTRCKFCKNNCARTFIDVRAAAGTAEDPGFRSKVPLASGYRRVITGFSCDRGTVEDVAAMRGIKAKMDSALDANPNTVEEMSRAAFKPVQASPAIPHLTGARKLFHRGATKTIAANRAWRQGLRIGIPRVLNMYSLAPFFMGYFQSLGFQSKNILFSSTTSEQMYKQGATRGAIDPCFPSKLGIPHVHDLLGRVHKKRRLDYIFFPIIDSLPSPLRNVAGCKACPTVAGTPEAVKAAFTKEGDLFAEHGVVYLNPFVNLDHRPLLRKQLLDDLQTPFRLHPYENDLAVTEGLEALARYEEGFRRRGLEIIRMLERERRLGFVVLARPYHNDPGVNHEILLKIQRLGYPVLAQDSLPTDQAFLRGLFAADIEREVIEDPMEIHDVWPTSYSENTSRKVWAAKFVARHPNLVALELSSFKCGHDAPPYTVIERIISASKTPFFTFRDLDENAPEGSINIRLETMDYFLRREQEKLRSRPSPVREGAPGCSQQLQELAELAPVVPGALPSRRASAATVDSRSH